MEALFVIGIIGAIIAVCSSSGSGSSSSSSTHHSSPSEVVTNDRYTFELRDVGGEWRAYILDQPGYQGRDTSAHATHRLSDSRGRYVCWSAPIRSKAECHAVAQGWTRDTDQYIRTGKRF